jgi:hypothetical protein
MRRILAVLVLALAGVGALFGVETMSSGAASPEPVFVTVPKATTTWTGTIPARTARHAVGSCNDVSAGRADEFDVAVAAPTRGATFVFAISWKPISKDEASADEMLTVDGPDGVVGSSNGSGTTETVVARNLRPGTYRVLACGDANIVRQSYTGTLKVATARQAG